MSTPPTLPVPSVGRQEAGDAAEERRLAGAARAQERDELVLVDGEADASDATLPPNALLKLISRRGVLRRSSEHDATGGDSARRRAFANDIHTRRLRSHPDNWSSAVTTISMTAMIVKRRESRGGPCCFSVPGLSRRRL